ncbi:MAG TPA: acyl carrier protein [Burkholderiales bacterium]|nr:acyl carrier protein [Burkholderiales bacterium]
MEHELRQFIIEKFLFGQSDVEFTNDDSFIERGIIDSTGVLELVAFLEEKYQVQIHGEDLVPANLDTIRNIMLFVERKRQSHL